MAEAKEEYPLDTPQEHVSMCEKHDLMPIEILCEDCDKFICSKCVKEDHKDHNWNTIITASTLTARGLMNSMKKIEEEDIKIIDEGIKRPSQRIESNNEKYEIENAKIQRHYDAMVKMINKSKEKHEETMRRNLYAKNTEVREMKSKKLTKLKASVDHILGLRPFQGTYESGNNDEKVLMSMMGRTPPATSSAEAINQSVLQHIALYSLRMGGPQ
uniref:RING finger domain and kelch repeat-containing protein DDB_G0271372-like n=1 Tax=Crassostrea virginica TaxID=6565 RepID=A0A8B8E7Y5_CRAVI|nr:RING finger domain and kelch repeat-containing protein DDB_G0271372-like [Crassostrea virginica]